MALAIRRKDRSYKKMKIKLEQAFELKIACQDGALAKGFEDAERAGIAIFSDDICTDPYIFFELTET